MHKFRYYSFQSPGGTVPYVRVGRGEPLFLVPAFHSDIDRLAPLIQYLSSWFEVIVPELPGIGCTAALNGKPYTTDHYADLYIDMIRSLKLPKYILGGLCLGGIIAIQMLKRGITPNKVFLFETFTSGSMIHPYWFQKIMLPFIRHAKNSVGARRLLANILKNEPLLSTIIRLIYWAKPEREAIVTYQTRITSMMRADAIVDSLNEMLELELFSGVKKRWTMPTMLLSIAGDPILDMPAATIELKKHFPNASELRVNFDDHAPRGPMTHAQVTTLMKDVAPMLQKI